MDRVAVFVDAGYLFAQGSIALSGKKLSRGRLKLDYLEVVARLEAFAKRVSTQPLLRIYWYDGTSDGPTPQHLALAYLPGVKLRLGFVNSFGQQKGVDSLIVTDMITLARNRAMADAVLLSGDEDLRVGVQQAQEHGVRVHLLGIAPARGNQSQFLLQEVDSTHEWKAENLEPFLSLDQKTGGKKASSVEELEEVGGSDEDHLRRAASLVVQSLAEADLRAVLDNDRESRRLPPEIDGRLLATAAKDLGRLLESAEKRDLRDAFRELGHTELGDS